MIDFRIEEMAPRFLLSDTNGRAMAKAMEAGMKMALEVARRGVEILLDVQAMPEWRLDELAWELNTPWYIHDAGVAAKRSAIQRGESINRRLGTPWAVERVAEMYFGQALVEEWQEYGGEPYHFRVKTANLSAAVANSDIIRELVERTKNLRSVYDGVLANPQAPATSVYVGTLIQTTWKITLGVRG